MTDLGMAIERMEQLKESIDIVLLINYFRDIYVFVLHLFC